MSTARKEAETYACERLIAHLAGAGECERLFELVEKRGFLAHQADFLKAFGRTSEDVETFLLPAAIAAGAWDRFLHFAALALNLRGLAEDLAEPEILGALARSEHEHAIKLALDAVGRLIGLWDQAEALAAVAAGCPASNPRRKEVLDLLCDRLDDFPAALHDQTRAGEALLAIAAQVGPELQERWPGWIRHFAPDRVGEIRLALATRWLQEDDALSPGLWQSLEALGNPSQVMAIAPQRLADLKPADPEEVIARLGPLLPGTARRQEAGAAFLGRLAEHDPARAMAAWEAWTARERPTWTPRILRAAAGILGHLPPPQLAAMTAAISDPSALAVLRVAVLEKRSTRENAAAALTAVAAMPDDEDKLHWSLRSLTALPQEPSKEVSRMVTIMGEHLHSIGYAVDGDELARYLDLVAVHLSGATRTRLECIVWSYGLPPEKLLQIARATTQPAVARLLLERAERYAAAVSATESAGFELRRQFVINAACSHVRLTKSLEVLPGTIERLLPEEEDELRETLAPRLLAAQDARGLCEAITDQRRRVATRLRLAAQEDLAEELTPSRLYASLAQVAALEEERSGLAALLERPDNPQGLLQQHVLSLRALRTRALLRVARHAIAFEREAFRDHPDLLLPAELVRWLLIPENNEELIELTPEITEISAAAGGKRAVQEVQEASRRLAGLVQTSRGSALQALEEIVSRAAAGLLTGRQAAEALTTMARLPRDLQPETARQALRACWSEILPWIAAAADRLPTREQKRVRAGIQQGVAALGAGEQRKNVFRLCLATPAERAGLVPELETASDPETLRALLYLEASSRPGRAADLLRRLPEPASTELALRLIRHRWLPPEEARELASHLTGGALAEADIWLGPASPGDSAWIQRAAFWLSQEGKTPSQPEIEPVLEALRQAPDLACRALAGELVAALRRGRRSHGEAFLRTWLHARLPVRWGHSHPEGAQRIKEARESLQRALTLDSGAADHA